MLRSVHGFFCCWLSRPTELCCREGPDGGTGRLGRNPRKLLGAPPSSGRPLNGCSALEAWQLGGKSTRRSTSKDQQRSCSRSLLLLLPLLCQQRPMRLARGRGETELERLRDGA
ncbi:hypothetical protein HU200_053087 [Digitaria exilis]|uniref:Uncharacterized protein n=1 Tax=Digitaria exilis TaxID=1010633 RepID=A0A835ASX8_9POAL|nr:hypothetical protein HU200_053087 [Digitaria exilis]